MTCKTLDNAHYCMQQMAITNYIAILASYESSYLGGSHKLIHSYSLDFYKNFSTRIATGRIASVSCMLLSCSGQHYFHAD